jgi:CRISPR-associated protein Cas6
MPPEEQPARFVQMAGQRLKEMGIEGEPGIPLNEKGAHAGEPRRRIVHIKGKMIVGYPLLVQGLTADESIRLQEVGLGGRTRIGCGFFVPYRERA